MKRILVLLPLLLISSVSLFSQNKITGIEIYGNKNVGKEKILVLMKTKIGMEFSEGVIRKDVETLSETGYFSSVKYEIGKSKKGVVVKIFVVENPVIRRVIFKGNRVFRTKKLRKFLGVEEGEIFNELKLKRGIEEIENKYKKKGLALVKIDYKTYSEDGKIDIEITIEEKGRVYVENIIFEGNTAFPSSRLRKLMKIKRRRMPFIRGTFKEEIFKDDIERIKKFYLQNGFLDTEVKGQILPSKKGRIILKIYLKEGKKYYLGNIEFLGDLIFKKEEIKKVLILKNKGEVFSREKADKNIQEILKFYYEKGYIKAGVEEIPSIGEKENILNITYYIQPGEIYYAEEIKIKGNTKTKDKVIRRELKIEPGDKITSGEIKRSYIRLRDLNYFDAINIYPEFKETPGKADVVIDVKEKEKTGLFLIGGGYSSVDKFVGMVSIEQRNFDIANPPSFVGGGQDISLTFEIGTEARNYKLSFTEPYFLDKPVWIGPDIYRLRREWDDYTVESTGGDLRIGRRWENFSLGFTFTSEKNELSDIDIPSLKSQEGTLRKNSFLVSLTYSNLDSRLYPTKGDNLKIGVEYAGGIFQGDIDFIKPTFENNFYWPFKKFIFHSKTYIGVIKEIGDTEDIPIYERFFGGGIGTVRGYEERTLGPKEEGKALGGKSIFAQNFELVYPLYKEILKGVIFFDAGNVWEKWGSFSDLKKGVGAGLRIIVPILRSPIEIYYGYALDREEGESKGRFHIGMSFGF